MKITRDSIENNQTLVFIVLALFGWILEDGNTERPFCKCNLCFRKVALFDLGPIASQILESKDLDGTFDPTSHYSYCPWITSYDSSEVGWECTLKTVLSDNQSAEVSSLESAKRAAEAVKKILRV